VVVLLEEVPSQLRDSNIITRAVVLLHSLLLALLNQFSFRPLGHPLLDERRGGEHLTENKIESRGISPLADRCQTEKLGTFLRGSTSRRRLVFALPRKDEEEQTRRLAHNRGIGQ
jgi:hypothetical protein